MFEAVKGRGFTGDIAVDDILYQSGSCGQPGKGLLIYYIYTNLVDRVYSDTLVTQGFRFFSKLVGQSDPWSKKWWVIF